MEEEKGKNLDSVLKENKDEAFVTPKKECNELLLSSIAKRNTVDPFSIMYLEDLNESSGKKKGKRGKAQNANRAKEIVSTVRGLISVENTSIHFYILMQIISMLCFNAFMPVEFLSQHI